MIFQIEPKEKLRLSHDQLPPETDILSIQTIDSSHRHHSMVNTKRI